ncbi:unnamed protein product, partial [Urochloa humidicola]
SLIQFRFLLLSALLPTFPSESRTNAHRDLLRIRRPPPIPSLLHDPPPSPINMDSEPSSQNPTDMTAFVQNLLGQMQTRFESMSQNIVSKNIL